MDINEKRQRLGELVTAQRGILDKADAEKRSLTAEETQEYDRMDAEVEKLDGEIQAAHLADQRRSKNAERVDSLKALQTRGVRPEVTLDGKPAEEKRGIASREYEAAFRSFLVRGEASLSVEEKRALSAGVGSEGQYTVPQEQFVAELLKAVDNEAPIMGLARKFDVAQAQTLGGVALDTDLADADWTTELLVGSEDTSMAFGRRELKPNPLAKLLKVSKKLLRASPIGVEAVVRDRLAYKIAVPTETAFCSGTGASQPLGIFTASAQGISTSRDVTVSTTSALDADKLIDARYTIRPGYKPTWILSRTTLAAIRKLKATTGDYLWLPGLSSGAPSVLLDFPCIVDEYATAFSTSSGTYIAVLGDFNYYWVARALSIEIQRLDELYAATNQVGFIVRSEIDGMPVLEDAFVRCKM